MDVGRAGIAGNQAGHRAPEDWEWVGLSWGHFRTKEYVTT